MAEVEVDDGVEAIREGVVTVAILAAVPTSPAPVGDFDSAAALVEYVDKSLWPGYVKERNRIACIDTWYRGDQSDPSIPRGATKELKQLLSLSKTPWLGLVVTTIAQAMYVDGYRSLDARENSSGPWETWNANDFDTRQVAIHRAALAYGHSYVVVTPGQAPDGSSRSVMRGVSPKKMFAVYEDPASDDFPAFALRVDQRSKDSFDVKVYDSTAVHELTVSSDEASYVRTSVHGAGVCPVVRYTNLLDLDGRTPGEVEPFIPIAQRIDKTLFDRLLVQHYNSWKVRYIAGMADFADSEEEANAKKFKLRQEDLLVAADPDTKFGTLDETTLGGFIDAATADIEFLAAVSQLPNHLLTGKMVNLSAEALAAARAPLTQKIYERQVSFGASHARALRLAAKLQNDTPAANDVMARVTWQDVEVRSLSQAVDALGKASQMLGIPKQDLWARIPGVTQSDVEEWKVHALDDSPLNVYLRNLDNPRPGLTDGF